MKKVTFSVDFTVRINDDVDPNDVNFAIDPGWAQPLSVKTGEAVGYCNRVKLVSHSGEPYYPLDHV